MDPRTPPAGIPYNIVTTFMAGYEEAMQTNDRICAPSGGQAWRPRAQRGRGAKGGARRRHGMAGTVWQVPPPGADFLRIGQVSRLDCADGAGEGERAGEMGDAGRCCNSVRRPSVTMPSRSILGAPSFSAHLLFCRSQKQGTWGPDSEPLSRDVRHRDEALRGVPMRCKSGFPTLDSVGGYGDALTRIKRALDPNNILGRNMGLFEEVGQ